jgi:predicted dehydrogenase
MNPTRRTFLKHSVLALGAASASNVLGANERVRVGMVGLGGRGMSSAKWFSEIPGVEVVFLCDVEQKSLDRAAKDFPEAKAARDMREVFDDAEVDAVVVSTCNHWHALAGIWACQAGKDVYMEKPVSHNIWEGRKLVEAARKYDRIVQGGTQQRSDALQPAVKEFLDSGEIGKIQYVRCNRYGKRDPIGKRSTPLAPPPTTDYNLWLGPAQDLPIYREQFHYDWHWVWNTGNGELGNWGPHLLDDLRNVVFRDRVKLPKRVIAGGGRLGWDDAGETPNTHFVYMDTGEVPVIVDVHNLPRAKGVNAGDTYARRRTGGFLVIECEGGYYAGGRGGGAAFDPDGKRIQAFSGDGGGDHARNFIDAVRSRKREDLAAEIEEIHYSSAWCHLGNISWRLGQAYQRGQAEAAVAGSGPWKDVIADFHQHLDANEIDPSKWDVMLGAALEIDAEAETFTGPAATPEALALLRREYRGGFAVPEQV